MQDKVVIKLYESEHVLEMVYENIWLKGVGVRISVIWFTKIIKWNTFGAHGHSQTRQSCKYLCPQPLGQSSQLPHREEWFASLVMQTLVKARTRSSWDGSKEVVSDAKEEMSDAKGVVGGAKCPPDWDNSWGRILLNNSEHLNGFNWFIFMVATFPPWGRLIKNESSKSLGFYNQSTMSTIGSEGKLKYWGIFIQSNANGLSLCPNLNHPVEQWKVSPQLNRFKLL